MSIITKLFGPFKEDVWNQLAKDYDGIYQDGTWGSSDKVCVYIEPWEIILDTFTRQSGKHRKTYTRIRAPFINTDDFYFKIYHEQFFHQAAKYFGMQDIQIGDEKFDDSFIVKGNDEFKIQWVFDNPKIQALLYDIVNVRFEIRSDEGIFIHSTYKEGIDEVYFEVRGVIKDINELKRIFDLFSMLLNKITELDTGYS